MTHHDHDDESSKTDKGEETEDFAALLESYMTDMKPEVRVGDKISGEIIAIGKDAVFFNTGTKSDGVVEKAELLDENGELSHKVGDRLDLYVVDTRDGEIRLSKAMGAGAGVDMLYEAHKSRIPVEGKVIETCKGGFRVQVMGQTAFCPVSQMDVHYVEKPEEFVGAVFPFLIERIEARGKNLVVNRRRLLEQELAEQREKFLAQARPGDIVDGRVVRIMPYGAFMELHPGVEGMVHISELSWSRVGDPSEVAAVGDVLPVRILAIDKTGSKTGGLKISLSAKQAAGDPWKTIGEKYKEGDKIEGKVTRCADFGAFVEVEPGIEGLVHISEMSHTRRVVKAEDVARPGDRVAVMVTTVDPVKRRLSLSIKAAEGDPWLTVANRMSVGQTVAGTVERVVDFGCFISLLPGVTGLMPRSNMERAADPKAMEKLKADDPVTVKIEAVNLADKKITLAPADAEAASDWKQYTGNEPRQAGGLGDLGRKLQDAMKSKG